MAGIVAQHVLPYFMKNRTVLSTKSVMSLGDGGVDVAYTPIGATIAVNTDEKKYRFVEQMGHTYVERYCLLANGQHVINDMDVLFARIYDGSTFAKYLVNKSGIQRVLKDWRCFVDDDRYCGQSYFTNNFDLNGQDNYLETLLYTVPDIDLFPENALSEYYQSDLSGRIPVPRNVVHPMQPLRDYLEARMHAIMVGILPQLMHLRKAPDDVLCDTGNIKKVDFFSWLTRDGDLAASDIYPYMSKNNRWLLLQEDDMEEHCKHLLDVSRYYDVAYTLQLSCLTDFNLCYILPKRSIQFVPGESSVLCRYGNITEKESRAYIETLGMVLQPNWPTATRIEVTKTWQNDAFITITYEHTCVTYYVDLTIFALLTRSLSHL